jgi:hypothetical protein
MERERERERATRKRKKTKDDDLNPNLHHASRNQNLNCSKNKLLEEVGPFYFYFSHSECKPVNGMRKMRSFGREGHKRYDFIHSILSILSILSIHVLPPSPLTRSPFHSICSHLFTFVKNILGLKT